MIWLHIGKQEMNLIRLIGLKLATLARGIPEGTEEEEEAEETYQWLGTRPVQMAPVQIRMARAAVGWGVRELAEKAGVTASTVTRIENGSDARQSTIAAIRAAFEAAGVVFIADNGGGPGVRLGKPVPEPDSIRPDQLNASNDE